MSRFLACIFSLGLVLTLTSCNLSDPGGNGLDASSSDDATTDTSGGDAKFDVADGDESGDTTDDANQADGSDVTDCEAGLTACASGCTDTDTDPDNCGACNAGCAPPPNAQVNACREGDCLYECQEGYYDLNDNLGDPAADGCEADCKPSNGGVELCGDGLDNDCNGEADDGCQCDIGQTQDCGTDIGVCQTGTQDCQGTEWGECQGAVVDSDEICDGLDNDCDGETDENPTDVGNSCDTGLEGACANGTQVCSSGGAIECQQNTTATDEICDGIDNDCDGQVDENPVDAGGSCDTGNDGVCAAGTEVCTGGSLSCEQNQNSSAETCNNLDDDCDGQIDDGVTRTCGTNTGACSTGAETCSAGAWGSCQGNTAGSTETCDGQDNDCDGQTDEGFSAGSPCTVGTGACEASGTYVCNAAGDGTICDASPGSASSEVCDGIDNDCDGQVDDGVTRTCGTNAGVCSTGTEYCSNGSWGSCQGNVSGSSETCDGQDNDCDGSTDEGYSNGAPCTVGTGACQRTGTLVCNGSGSGTVCDASPGSPSTEVCDNVDNDCDGQVDEGVTRSCGTNTGVCSTGTSYCSSGLWGSCVGSTSPSTEVCDGQDNDCDGSTDEGVRTTFYFDSDGDGYGTSSSITACNPSGDYTATQSRDCDDGNSSVYPGATNVFCSGTIDYDCDGTLGCRDNNCSTGDACSTSSALGQCSGDICDTGGGGGNCSVLCAFDEYCTCGGTLCCPEGQLCACP